MSRTVHFVGSIPGTDVEDVMRASLRRAGTGVRSITDGEIDERRNWIIPIIDGLRNDPDLEQTRTAGWTSYQDIPRYRVRRGHRFTGDHVDLPQFANFEHAYPIFQKVRSELDLPELAFQVGIPGDIDLALFTFGPVRAFRHRKPFADALGRQMAMIQAQGGEDVIFQLELPVELVLVTRLPAPAQRAMAAFLSRGLARLVRRAPAGSRFGVHLCLGDMNHRALGRLRDVAPLVRLSNAVTARWPADRALEFIHVPLAAADQPPSLDPKFYAPLRRLHLPTGARLVAGLVHEERDLAELRVIRDLVEARFGAEVDLATSCGLGRRSSAQAEQTVDLARELTVN